MQLQIKHITGIGDKPPHVLYSPLRIEYFTTSPKVWTPGIDYPALESNIPGDTKRVCISEQNYPGCRHPTRARPNKIQDVLLYFLRAQRETPYGYLYIIYFARSAKNQGCFMDDL